jgi:hypothetical protein
MFPSDKVLDRIQRVAEQDQEPDNADEDKLANPAIDLAPAVNPFEKTGEPL